ATRRSAVLRRRADLRGARLRGHPCGPAQTGRRRMTYTAAALLGVLGAILVGLFVLRTRLVTRVVFWATYPIIIAFQLLSNGILTGRRIVVYDPDAIIGLRAPLRPAG